MRSTWPALGLAAALALAPRPAWAYLQWSAAVTLGGGGRIAPGKPPAGIFVTGLRADALFGPRAAGAARVGAFAAASAIDFASLVVSAGMSALAPVTADAPLVFSLGAAWELAGGPAGGSPLGVVGRVWWGSRSANLHARYGMSAGLWVETRWRPDGGAVDVVAGLDGDLGFASLPLVALWNWISR